MQKSGVFSFSNVNSPENNDFLAILVTKAKNGQESAFGEIYNLFFKKIFQFIYYRVGHKEIAEDLAEEAFIKAFTKINSLADDTSFQGWLYQIARNLVIDHYRNKKMVVALEDVENTLEYESNIIDVLSLEEQQKTLLGLLRELEPTQQAVIKLKFLENLDNPAIAALLEKSEGAIRVIQHRAIARLKELLKKMNTPR